MPVDETTVDAGQVPLVHSTTHSQVVMLPVDVREAVRLPLYTGDVRGGTVGGIVAGGAVTVVATVTTVSGVVGTGIETGVGVVGGVGGIVIATAELVVGAKVVVVVVVVVVVDVSVISWPTSTRFAIPGTVVTMSAATAGVMTRSIPRRILVARTSVLERAARRSPIAHAAHVSKIWNAESSLLVKISLGTADATSLPHFDPNLLSKHATMP